MGYRRFALFNVTGGIAWVSSMTLGGYFLGTLFPDLGRHVEKVIVVIVALSVMPMVIEYFKARARAKASLSQGLIACFHPRFARVPRARFDARSACRSRLAPRASTKIARFKPQTCSPFLARECRGSQASAPCRQQYAVTRHRARAPYWALDPEGTAEPGEAHD